MFKSSCRESTIRGACCLLLFDGNITHVACMRRLTRTSSMELVPRIANTMVVFLMAKNGLRMLLVATHVKGAVLGIPEFEVGGPAHIQIGNRSEQPPGDTQFLRRALLTRGVVAPQCLLSPRAWHHCRQMSSSESACRLQGTWFPFPTVLAAIIRFWFQELNSKDSCRHCAVFSQALIAAPHVITSAAPC